MTMRLLLVDDHALFRESVARLLQSEPDFGHIAQCATAAEAIEIVKHEQIDLVLLDLDLGTENGSDLADDLRAGGYQGKILIVAAGVDENEIPSFIRKGIAGVFMKHNSPALLIQGIRDAMRGKVWFEQDLLQRAFGERASVGPADSRPSLSPREKNVLSFVFQGLTNKEIADKTGMSLSLVKACLQGLFSKTGVRTRSQLVRVALEQYKDEL